MMITTAASYNPILSIVFLDIAIHKTRYSYKTSKTKFVIEGLTRYINLTFASIGQLFYIWACAHSYGIIDKEGEKPGPWGFYFPKLLLLVAYGAARGFMRGVLNLSPSKLPLVTLAAAIANFRALKYWPADILTQVSVFSLLEILFLVCVVRRIWLTSNRLRQIGYLKHRSRQLGVSWTSLPFYSSLFSHY